MAEHKSRCQSDRSTNHLRGGSFSFYPKQQRRWKIIKLCVTNRPEQTGRAAVRNPACLRWRGTKKKGCVEMNPSQGRRMRQETQTAVISLSSSAAVTFPFSCGAVTRLCLHIHRARICLWPLHTFSSQCVTQRINTLTVFLFVLLLIRCIPVTTYVHLFITGTDYWQSECSMCSNDRSVPRLPLGSIHEQIKSCTVKGACRCYTSNRRPSWLSVDRSHKLARKSSCQRKQQTGESLWNHSDYSWEGMSC